jgi:hypothetical protein
VAVVAAGMVVRVANEPWRAREQLPPIERALDAEFVVRGPSGERVIPAAQWFEGYLTTSRSPDELLVEVRFPAAGRGTGVSFQEVARRHGDFAIPAPPPTSTAQAPTPAPWPATSTPSSAAGADYNPAASPV